MFPENDCFTNIAINLSHDLIQIFIHQANLNIFPLLLSLLGLTAHH